jgi:hypothetical protein
MNVKICAALLALSLAVPVVSMAAFVGVDNEVFALGEIAQGMDAEKDFKATQNAGSGNTQGGNVVVTGDMDKTIAQAADVDGKLALTGNAGNGNNQGLNLIKGQVTKQSAQAALIEGNVALVQNRGNGNTQGVNVVNGCADCGGPE